MKRNVLKVGDKLIMRRSFGLQHDLSVLSIDNGIAHCEVRWAGMYITSINLIAKKGLFGYKEGGKIIDFTHYELNNPT